MVHSQVRRGRPGRRLQSLGNPQIDVYRALAVSWTLSFTSLDRPHGTRCRHRYATVNYHPRSGMN